MADTIYYNISSVYMISYYSDKPSS